MSQWNIEAIFILNVYAFKKKKKFKTFIWNMAWPECFWKILWYSYKYTILYIRCSFEKMSNNFQTHVCRLACPLVFVVILMLHLCIQLFICRLLGGAIFQRIQAEVWLLQKEVKEAGKKWSVFRDITVSSFLSHTVFLDTLIYSVWNPCRGVKSIFFLFFYWVLNCSSHDRNAAVYSAVIVSNLNIKSRC